MFYIQFVVWEGLREKRKSKGIASAHLIDIISELISVCAHPEQKVQCDLGASWRLLSSDSRGGPAKNAPSGHVGNFFELIWD